MVATGDGQQPCQTPLDKYRSQHVSSACHPCGCRSSSTAESSVRAVVLHEQSSLLKISLSPRDICCHIHEIQTHSSVVFQCFADPTNNPCHTLAPQIPTVLWRRDLSRPIASRQMRQQKRHTEPAVYGFTCRFIRQPSASRWRAR